MTRRTVAAAVLALAAALSACSRAPQGLPSEPLPTVSGGVVSLAACPTDKCLTVKVAPWCPYCRAATPTLLRLRGYLAQRGVTMRFVVGLDREPAVRDYARKFGPDTVIDLHDAVPTPEGVPHFMVTDRKGTVLKDVPGMPQTDSLSELAEFFGLS